MRRTASQSSRRTEDGISRQEIKSSKDICNGFVNNNICNRIVLKSGQESIECQLCLRWYHARCAGLNEDAHRAIETHSLVWMCKQCQDLIPELREIQAEKQNPCEKQLERLSIEMAEIRNEVVRNVERLERTVKDGHDEIRNACFTSVSKAVADEVKVGVTNAIKPGLGKIEEAIAHHSRKTYAETLKNEVVEKLDRLSQQQQNTCHEHVANKADVVEEYVDRQQRKANLIISNVPEPSNASNEENRQQDWMMVDEMLRRLHLRVDVIKVSRIGRKNAGKTRLILVTLSSEDMKWEVLREAKNLRDFDEYHGVYINPDLTKTEREQNKKLRDEVREKREKGEDVVIYKGRIIKRSRPKVGATDSELRGRY